jgi:Bacterial archaeo-eukaryotic release factor family 2
MRLDSLRRVYEGTEYYASVYLDVSHAGEDAAEAVALRWPAAARRLSEAGAGQNTVGALGRLVTDPALAAPGLAAFARADGAVAFAASLPNPPRREINRYAPLPHLMPLLAQRPPPMPHVQVRADRAGGEVVAVRIPGDVTREEVAGGFWPVHKTSVGGWSQARYQRSAEEAWTENAKQLAEVVTTTAAQIRAELIVVGGDARARSLLLEHLGTPLRDLAVIVDREVDAESNVMAEAAEEASRARADERARQRLADFRAELGRGQATEGLAETLAALRDGQASDVFIADDPSSTDRAWIGPGPAQVAASETELRELGVDQIAEDRADAAIVRAVVATDAELHFIPEGEQPLRHGIGALLRYPLFPGQA